MSWSIAVNESKVEKIQLGDFHISCEPTTGSLQVAPVSAPIEAPPSFIAKPVSLTLDDTKLTVVPEAGNVEILLEELLNKLLNLPNIISTDSGRMSLRSFLGSLYLNLTNVQASVADISGVRLAAEEAKSAADDIREALQDASGALLQLAVATAASDLSGVLTRVSALEAAPAFDPAPVYALINDVSGSLAAKVDVAAYEEFVGQTNTAIGERALAADVETLGRVSKIDTVAINLDGLGLDYWPNEIINFLKPGLLAGKIGEVTMAANSSFYTDIGAETAGKVVRVRNAGVNEFTFFMGTAEAPLASFIVAPYETMTIVSDGTNWRLIY